MKITIAILIVIVAALGWQLSAEKTASSQQQTLIADLTTKLDNKTVRENLERQKTCAVQADKLYKELGYNSATEVGTSQNHFNAKLNKCFLSVTSIGGSTKFRFLIDAYEQRGYAQFGSVLTMEKDKVMSCDLMPPGVSPNTCKSEDEYDAFVARYME